MLLIKNNFYSISVPKEWEPYGGSDGNIPKVRFIRPCYDLHYLTWTTKVRKAADLERTILLSIDTYKRIDKQKITMDEIVNLEKKNLSSSKILMLQEENVSEREKKIALTRSIMEMGVLQKYVHIYLCVQSQDKVHLIYLTTRVECYELQQTKDIVQEVLDSFQELS